jgi:hypothetical protein
MRFGNCFIILALSLLAFSWMAQAVPASASPEGLPDLIVEDILWFPKEPHVGEDLSLQVIIRNVGDAPVKKMFRFELYIGRKESPIRWTFDAKEPMLPGDGWMGIFDINKEVRYYGWALSEGDHKLRAIVDSDHDVVESNEDNNELVKTIHIGPKLTTYTKMTTTATTSKVKGTTTMAIVSHVDYPRSVKPGEEFEIKVTIEYSSPYEIRVRLWDLDVNRPIDEVTDKFGPYMGTETYTFKLKASTEPTIWRLSVDVEYLLPYYIDQSRTYKRTEPGWYYNFEIYVGVETTTATISTTPTYSYEETQTQIEASTTAETYVMNASSFATYTSPLTVGWNLPVYTPYILGGLVALAVAIAFLALRAYRPSRIPAGVKHCVNCGVELPLDAEYCHECGAKQPPAKEEM